MRKPETINHPSTIEVHVRKLITIQMQIMVFITPFACIGFNFT